MREEERKGKEMREKEDTKTYKRKGKGKNI